MHARLEGKARAAPRAWWDARPHLLRAWREQVDAVASQKKRRRPAHTTPFTHRLPLFPPHTQHAPQKRLHAKDFKTARPSVWRQDGEGGNNDGASAGGRRGDNSFSTVMHNDAFEAYYKAQVGVVSCMHVPCGVCGALRA